MTWLSGKDYIMTIICKFYLYASEINLRSLKCIENSNFAIWYDWKLNIGKCHYLKSWKKNICNYLSRLS